MRGELRITPPTGLPIGRTFTTEIRYDGVPELVADGSGFIATDDGAPIVGEPEVAATWFPANDHPADKATFTFDVTVPDGLQAVGNRTTPQFVALAEQISGQQLDALFTDWLYTGSKPAL